MNRALNRPHRIGIAASVAILGVCVSSGSVSAVDRVAERFAEYDANGDAKITSSELAAGKAFRALDRDGDGSITLKEARRAVAAGHLEGITLPDPLPAKKDRKAGEETSESELRQGPRPIKANEHGVGALIPDLEFTDIQGERHRLSGLLTHEPNDAKALVIAMTGIGCPLCQKYTPTLAAIEKGYRSRGVTFVFVNPNESEEIAKLRETIRTHGFEGPYVRDDQESITRMLDVKTTTEVFVIDSARTLVYRGAVDDQYGFGYSLNAPRQSFLTSALDAVLEGERPEIAATTSPGCEMYYKHGRQDADAKLAKTTYHNRISRIIQDNCQQCHREEGLAPFSLSTYEAVEDYAGMIASVVRREIMPPWFAASQKDNEAAFDVHWANDRSLPARDRQDLLAWIDAGVPEGDPVDAPLPIKFRDDWSIGQPDLVVQIPKPFQVKATGQMPYRHTQVEMTLDEDRWVQAVEIQPTNRAVVHHVLVFIQQGGGDADIDEEAGFFAAYVPGNTFQQYPKGMAKRLPAGSKLVFQLHYTPNGTATTDQTRLGIVFSDEPPQRAIRNAGIANHRISIPPGASHHPETAKLRVPTDVRLLSVMPHMHLRGKAFRYDITFPDGRRQRLLDVPRYDFNWQLEYRLAEPLEVPRGSEIEVTGWYDNSDGNPANPDPTETVRWGPQTDDEMMLGYVEYYVTTESAPASQPSSESTTKKRARDKAIAAGLQRAFRGADKNQDGTVTRAEFPRASFDQLDLNGDELLTLEEVLEAGPNLR